MQKLYRFLPSLLLLSGAVAHAQTAGTVTFTANQTTATGSLVPVLTWSTTPVASSCVASGAWSGTKFASGSETLAAITTNQSYTLTCTWNNGSVSLTWTKPTQNIDNSALTDLTGYKVLYGTSSTALSQQKVINDAAATSTSITSLPAGTWYFAVRAINSQQAESDNSNVAQKTATSASAAKTLGITITPGTPPPPPPPPPPPTATLKMTATSVYDVVWTNGVRKLGRVVGTAPIGTPCQSTIKVGTDYYKVNKTAVQITTQPRSTNVFGKCAMS